MGNDQALLTNLSPVIKLPIAVAVTVIRRRRREGPPVLDVRLPARRPLGHRVEAHTERGRETVVFRVRRGRFFAAERPRVVA